MVRTPPDMDMLKPASDPSVAHSAAATAVGDGAGAELLVQLPEMQVPVTVEPAAGPAPAMKLQPPPSPIPLHAVTRGCALARPAVETKIAAERRIIART
jgi:hypothetical protein